MDEQTPDFANTYTVPVGCDGELLVVAPDGRCVFMGFFQFIAFMWLEMWRRKAKFIVRED